LDERKTLHEKLKKQQVENDTLKYKIKALKQ